MRDAASNPPGQWKRPALYGIGVLALTFGVFGGWAAAAKLDSAIVAAGAITVESDHKLVQHLEGGIVSTILASDNQSVKEGDVLARLDSTPARATWQTAHANLMSALAEEARLVAEISHAEAIAFPRELTRSGEDEAVAKQVISDQERQFRDRRAARANEVGGLQERIEQSYRQIEGLKAQLRATNEQIKSFTAELEKLQPIVDKGFIPATRTIQIERQRTDQQGKAGSLEADLARQDRLIAETMAAIAGIDRKFVEEASERLTRIRASLGDLREKLRVADDVFNRLEVKAPRTGRIVNNKLHTLGAVIRPGETLMEIVPDDDRLVVSAHLTPNDVTHVFPGAAAEVRLPAFKARSTPIAIGEVQMLGADVLHEEANHQAYYELKVSVHSSSFPEEIRQKLRPGMPAEIVVATGERTVLAYLTQPLFDAMRRGLRED
jgi:HlyD family type I secretion membrane fusion protein